MHIINVYMIFKLDENNICDYKNKTPDFGYNGLGEYVYMKSYSRLIKDDDGNTKKERWYDTVLRVVNGTYSIQKNYALKNGITWSDRKAQKSATKMFKYMFDMKFLPAGRGLWAMGTDIIEKKGLFEALQSCAFVSTQDIGKNTEEWITPFKFMADLSMLGCGVGFDVKGANKRIIFRPNGKQKIIHVVQDSREGWVDAFSELLRSYTSPLCDEITDIEFNYSQIREKGKPLKTFGGYSSGYKPLEEALERIRKILNDLNGKYITESAITDIMNIIGDCIVAGGIRRTAQIAIGNADSEEFLNLKNYKVNSYRSEWMHRSNNSIVPQFDTDYSRFVDLIKNNGEPGLFWLDNAREYGRMGRYSKEKEDVDIRAMGANPCLEQTLESFEMCCLVEVFLNRIDNIEEFKDVLKYAYLYGKTVTLGDTRWDQINEVMNRNRRIGTSLSGIQQFINKHSLNKLRSFLTIGYNVISIWDLIYSDWLNIPQSIKTTSVKPSGTISLLAGATPGVHYPIAESKYYIRRVEVEDSNPLYDYALKKGYEIEPKLVLGNDGDWIPIEGTYVINFYIEDKLNDVKAPSMWEQLEMAAFMQEYWADNQVSVTVRFDPETEADQIPRALEFYQYRLKGVSFLPRTDLKGIYPQLPYEAITREEYIEKMENNHVSDFDMSEFDTLDWQQPEGEKGCNTDVCEVSDTT